MSDLMNLLGIGKSALLTAQRALSVTGQNIANVNTPGYTRQEVVLAATQPQDNLPGQVGTGVQVTEIRRSVAAAIEDQILQSRSLLGQLNVSQPTLAQVQSLFGDANGQSIGTALSGFFSALQNVATNPADPAARSVLLAAANTLTARFNQSASTLTTMQKDLDRQVGQTITETNSLTAQIADLNDRIRQAENGGQNANDLRDQRSQLLSELAQRIAISVREDAETGEVTVSAGRGRVLVDHGQAYQLKGVPSTSNGGLLDVAYDDGSGTGDPVTISAEISGGQLNGLLTLRDSTIAGLLTSLNTLAKTLVTQVNAQHQAGYGLDGSTGNAFFAAGGTTAATISVALTDPNQVAASGTRNGVPGDNANVLAIAALQNTSQSALGDLTVSEYYAVKATDLGAAAQTADSNLTAQQTVQDYLDAQRAEVSGVSLDEELVNMLQYQRGFQAASKVVTMTDELLQTVLSMKAGP